MWRPHLPPLAALGGGVMSGGVGLAGCFANGLVGGKPAGGVHGKEDAAAADFHSGLAAECASRQVELHSGPA